MAHQTVLDTMTTIHVTVRYFAAAQAAANSSYEEFSLLNGTTLRDLLSTIAQKNPRLASVLTGCSYLCNSVAVRDYSLVLTNGDTVDVLPPFAGG